MVIGTVCPADGAGRRSPANTCPANARVQDHGFQTRYRGTHLAIGSLDGEIRDGTHHMQVRVYFEDTDAGRIVYHANFLRFMERGRTNYLRLLGTNQGVLLQNEGDAVGFAFVVRSMIIDFLKPAQMDDVLDVVTIPQEVKGASINLLQQCRCGDDLLVEARVRVAFVSGGKAHRIPRALRDAIEGGGLGRRPPSTEGNDVVPLVR
jgi:acyl-CoA thioester hydrolase